MTRFALRHVTTYAYAKAVTASYGTHYLHPRELDWQHCAATSVTISPEPADLSHHLDAYGNTKTFFQVTEPHTELVITAATELEVRIPPMITTTVPWERARPSERTDRPEAWRAVEFTLESPLIDVSEPVRAYARASFPAGRPAVETLTHLMTRIHTDFEYRSGSTTVTTRVAEVLARRQGVCQDFAQLMVACLRSMGLAGRYVSGYLATRPPPGGPRLVGADASHAWVSCWLPADDPADTDGLDDRGAPATGRWLHLDPTNNRLIDESHATLAWGRDYGDVTPVRGVIYTTSSSSSLDVAVDMVSLD